MVSVNRLRLYRPVAAETGLQPKEQAVLFGERESKETAELGKDEPLRKKKSNPKGK
jgi:hypothetical protein